MNTILSMQNNGSFQKVQIASNERDNENSDVISMKYTVGQNII